MNNTILRYNDDFISELLRIAIGDGTSNNIEFEFIYGSNHTTRLKRDEFLDVLEYIQTNNNHKETSNSLDISCRINKVYINVRISINGVDNIKRYCKKDDLSTIPNEHIEYMKKSPYVDKSITNGRYNIIDNEFIYREHYSPIYLTLKYLLTKIFPNQYQIEANHLVNLSFSLLTIFGVSQLSKELFNKR